MTGNIGKVEIHEIEERKNQPLGLFPVLVPEIRVPFRLLVGYMTPLSSLLPSAPWFWSGLNGYPNTEPNSVFGALGIGDEILPN